MALIQPLVNVSPLQYMSRESFQHCDNTQGSCPETATSDINKLIFKKLSDLENRLVQAETNQRLQDELFRLKKEEK